MGRPWPVCGIAGGCHEWLPGGLSPPCWLGTGGHHAGWAGEESSVVLFASALWPGCSLAAPSYPQPARVSPAVLGVPVHIPTRRGAASTSVLHHLLTGLVEDVWARAHHGPGASGSHLEETVLHLQIRDPGRMRAFTGPNPRAAFELVSPELGCSPREPSCSNNFGKSDGACRLWRSDAHPPRGTEPGQALVGSARMSPKPERRRGARVSVPVETQVQIRPRPLTSPLAFGRCRPALPWPDLEKESDTPLQQVSIEEILEEQRVEQQAKQESEKLKVQALKERGLSVPRADTLDEY